MSLTYVKINELSTKIYGFEYFGQAYNYMNKAMATGKYSHTDCCNEWGNKGFTVNLILKEKKGWQK